MPPSSVLAPESALGSVPTVALSSAQVVVRCRDTTGNGQGIGAGGLPFGFPPFAGQGELTVALGEDLPLAALEFVLGGDVADGTV